MPLRDKKLLVVDDSPSTRRILSKLCAGLSMEIDIVSNPEEALERFQKTRHDFVLTNYILPAAAMPDASGLDFIIEARKIDPEVPCLIFTEFPDEHVRTFSEETSNCRFILKPLQFIELVHKLIAGVQIKTGQSFAMA